MALRHARSGFLVGALALTSFSLRARALVVETPPERARTEAVAEALRGEVRSALEDLPAGGALVVRVRSELPPEAPDPNGLVHALVHPSALALTDDARWSPVHVAAFEGEGAEAAARAARLGYATLVDLRFRVAGNFLSVEGAVWTTQPSTREPPRRGPAIEIVSRLDVDLRRYLGRLPRVRAENLDARPLALPSRGYLAMSVHDLDGDGRAELTLVTESGVEIVRLVDGALSEVARAPLPAEVPRAPSPTRRPLATALGREGAVIVRSSALAAPLRVTLGEDGAQLVRASGPCPDGAFPIGVGCASLREGRDLFDATIAPFGEGTPHQAAAHWYAYAARRLRTPEGRVVGYEALVTRQGRLALRIDGRPVGAVGYGTALAMAELDDDGSAELLASSAAAAGEGDRLSLLRALPRGAVHKVWESAPLEGSVWIATGGDLDGDGRDALLAIEEPNDPAAPARLWVVR